MKNVEVLVNTFLHPKTETKIMFVTLFYSFLKNSEPQYVIFEGKRSSIIILKLCKFNVNLWTLCFVLEKVNTCRPLVRESMCGEEVFR